MHVGFTGTKEGMTTLQHEAFSTWVDIKLSGRPITFHHGDCVGADKEADTEFRKFCGGMDIHPPKNPRFRAFCNRIETNIPTIVYEEKDYLYRNHDIVKACRFMIGCPKEMKEIIRSGTWATIRYAKKMGKPVVVFFPDGTFKENF